MHITHYGGAGGVTGSKHLLETDDNTRILFDCGTFQGLPDVRERNRAFPFAPEQVDHVVLSHAHIDHCGMLPLLVKRGFTGSIFATPATRDIAELMLKDSAGIEEQDAAYRTKHTLGAPDWREPLFTRDDIPAVMERFVAVPYTRERDEWHAITDSIRLKFYDAGHILGSAVAVVACSGQAGTKTVAYTGDIGAPGTPLLYDPEVPAEPIDTILIESTYGGREHTPLAEAEQRLVETIKAVCDRQGKIIIPAFSLGRTQVLVYVLHKLTDEGKIPRFPIYVDSPLATNLTEVYMGHRQYYDDETWADFAPQQGGQHVPLAFENLTYTRSKRESQALNRKLGPFAVISASGMMTAGRVVHHLRHSISDPKNAVFITGYQADGTLGRRLLEGAKRVELYGDYFTVKADIHIFNEFSAHVDQQQLTNYLEAVPGLKQVVLVHGEPKQADQFRARLSTQHPEWTVHRPDEGDTLDL